MFGDYFFDGSHNGLEAALSVLRLLVFSR